MQGKQLLTTFQKSIGKLEFFIQNLENNLGLAKTPSPLTEKHSVNTSDLQSLIQNQKKAQLQSLINANNENIKYFVKEQEEKEAPKEEEAKKQEQPQKQQKKPQPIKENNKKENTKKEGKKKGGNSPKKNEEFEPVPEQFYNIDIRVGNIVECARHPDSEKLYCEKIDIGGEIRSIASGLQQFVPIEQMSGLCLVVTNLKPMKMAGFESNGMVLCTSTEDPERQVELLRPPQGSQVGQRVTLENNPPASDEKPGVLNPKKKLLIKALPYFKSDAELFANFNGYKWTLPSGHIKSTSIKNGQIA